MPIVKEIEAKKLYGVSIPHQRGYWRDCPLVLVASSWNHAKKAFNTSLISSEGVMGNYQAIRFNGKEQAQLYISQHEEDLKAATEINPEENVPYTSITRGPNAYMQIPIVGWDEPVWVQARKWTYIPDKQKAKIIDDAPEFFGDNATEQGAASLKKSNGFNFGNWRSNN